jgi:hypothetical protein
MKDNTMLEFATCDPKSFKVYLTVGPDEYHDYGRFHCKPEEVIHLLGRPFPDIARSYIRGELEERFVDRYRACVQDAGMIQTDDEYDQMGSPTDWSWQGIGVCATLGPHAVEVHVAGRREAICRVKVDNAAIVGGILAAAKEAHAALSKILRVQVIAPEEG